jgi:hypothetical protein
MNCGRVHSLSTTILDYLNAMENFTIEQKVGHFEVVPELVLSCYTMQCFERVMRYGENTKNGRISAQ